MIVLITGGSKCGKSSYAEKQISKLYGDKYYIATMEPFSNEAKSAIKRHRKARENGGYSTIEQYTDIECANISENSIVLLECIANLCANEMFSKGYNKDVEDKIINGILNLAKKTKVLYIITNEVGGDSIDYSDETKAYIENMGKINRRLSDMAEVVIESVYGIPVFLKGNETSMVGDI